MAMSVLVMGGLIIALYFIGQFFYGNEAPPRNVDYACTAQEAREAVEWPLYTPQNVPEGWTSNHARFTPGVNSSWRMGMITADGDYIGLEQHGLSVDDALAKYAPDSTEVETTSVAGHLWQVFADERNNISFIRSENERIVLITGNAPRTVIEDYITSLATSTSPTLDCR